MLLERKRAWTHRRRARNCHIRQSWKIIDSFCTQVGSDRFPKSWNGAIPNQEQREAFYARVRQGQAQNTGAGSSSAAYTSEGEGSEEEDSEEEGSEEEGSEEEDSEEEDSEEEGSEEG